MGKCSKAPRAHWSTSEITYDPERGLLQKEVIDLVTHPDRVEPSAKDPRRFLVKKVYFNKVYKKDRLLMAVCEQEEDSALVVVTVKY
ncbi:MAG: hypothetical protein Q8R25_01210 [bacterium]|nr:hypothetical protein [bacterium]